VKLKNQPSARLVEAEKLKVVFVGLFWKTRPEYKLLEKHNIDVECWWTPLHAEPKAELFVCYLPKLTKQSIDFSIYQDLAKGLKKTQPNCKILFAGPTAHENPTAVLNNSQADFVCIGDDDAETILELCQKFDQPFAYDGICGLGNKKEGYPIGLWAIFLSNKRPKKRGK